MKNVGSIYTSLVTMVPAYVYSIFIGSQIQTNQKLEAGFIVTNEKSSIPEL